MRVELVYIPWLMRNPAAMGTDPDFTLRIHYATLITVGNSGTLTWSIGGISLLIILMTHLTA